MTVAVDMKKSASDYRERIYTRSVYAVLREGVSWKAAGIIGI
jgi:hypothetical protein